MRGPWSLAVLDAVQTQGKKTACPNNLQPNRRQSTVMQAATHGEEKEKQGKLALSQHSCVCGWTAHVTRV